MIKFLKACDTPNWAVILYFLLCYMYAISIEKLENLRRFMHEKNL